MNFQVGICPKCRENYNIELLKENIIIFCNCGYHNSINIKEFVDEYQRKKSLLKDKLSTIIDFTPFLIYSMDKIFSYIQNLFTIITAIYYAFL